MIGPCGGSHAADVPKLVNVCADQVLPCWGAAVVPHLMVTRDHLAGLLLAPVGWSANVSRSPMAYTCTLLEL